MLRASDMPWYLAALGGAAEVGVDVFCKETLAGDWLETIGLWQPAGTPAYTPHPDFWVAALWNKLMGTRALGANTTVREAPRRWVHISLRVNFVARLTSHFVVVTLSHALCLYTIMSGGAPLHARRHTSNALCAHVRHDKSLPALHTNALASNMP